MSNFFPDIGNTEAGYWSANTSLTLLWDTTTIDVQIQAIQDATPAERVQLMNQFKIQVSNMNAEDRSAF